MHTLEWYEKRKIKKFLDSIGAWHFSPFMAGRGASGVPDIIACINGVFVGIEVKRPGGKPTRLQLMRMSQIIVAQGQAIWGDAEHVIKAISESFGYAA